MFDDRTSRRVGAVVLALVVAAGAAVVTVDASRLRPTLEVTVYFAHLGSLEEGAHVQRAGRVLGRVEAVQLVSAARATAPSHPLHPAGGVAVRLRIQKRYATWAAPNDEFFIAVKGVLGDAYIEIGPPPKAAERQRDLREGDQLRGVDPPRMDQVLVKSFQNMTEFRRLLDEAAPAARQLSAELERLGQHLEDAQPGPGAYAALRGGLADLGREWDDLTTGMAAEGAAPGDVIDLARRASTLIGRLRTELGATGHALDQLLADIARIQARLPDDLRDRLASTATAARAAVAKVDAQLAAIQDLVASVRSGRGTIGALLGDPEFIDDAKKLGKILKREPWRILGHPRREALEKQP